MPRICSLGLVLLISLTQSRSTCAEELSISKVEPPNWWTNMNYNNVQLMLRGSELRGGSATFDRPGIQVAKYHSVANDRYAFVDVIVAPDAEAGQYQLAVSKGDSTAVIDFFLHRRGDSTNRHQGFGPQDVVYLITPDRFANGDRANDRVEGILDEYDPSDVRMRHGGDLQGVIDHLDYIAGLGCTAIWLNPVLENNGVSSYHGYKTTNLYRIDPRFGTNDTYRRFVDRAHARGLKVIFDHVSNHVGIRHPWIEDLPTDDWLNGSVANHLSSKHYLLSITDPHADRHTVEQLKTFWFVDKMPDLNQRNPFLSRYLIQNSLWWIEFAGIDGIREDTYPYADQTYLAEWAKTIRDEYPRFNIVGEIWAEQPAYLAHFQQRTILPRDFETHLPSVMDFPLMEAFRGFLRGTGKLRDVHAVYAQDFLYTDPNNLLVFLDNHDSARAAFLAEGNVDRVKLALTVMCLGRGIPQLLYGTEINLRGGASHVELRADFPGGFPTHNRSAFQPQDRTQEEQDMFRFLQRLLKIRGRHPAVTRGAMIHYPPTWNQDVYMFLRLQGDEKILVIANGHDEARTVDLSDARHHLRGVSKLADLMEDQEVEISTSLSVPAQSAKVWKAIGGGTAERDETLPTDE